MCRRNVLQLDTVCVIFDRSSISHIHQVLLDSELGRADAEDMDRLCDPWRAWNDGDGPRVVEAWRQGLDAGVVAASDWTRDFDG